MSETFLQPVAKLATERVIDHIRALIESGAFKPGDRLPTERDLAGEIGVSRPTLRTALRSLAAMGIIRSRHGAGTFITGSPASLDSRALQLMACLQGFTAGDLSGVRLALEAEAAGLAAERATGDQVTGLAQEAGGMLVTVEEPRAFLRHLAAFRRAMVEASGNPLLLAFIQMIPTGADEEALLLANRRQLRSLATLHQQLYVAIRARAAERARKLVGRWRTSGMPEAVADARTALAQAS